MYTRSDPLVNPGVARYYYLIDKFVDSGRTHLTPILDKSKLTFLFSSVYATRNHILKRVPIKDLHAT